jgi:hypothetical protein
MENEDDEEIARKLTRMDKRTAQRRKHSSSSSDEDDGEEVALDNRWKQAKLDHKSSQDFSQDLSDEEEALAPAPVAAALTTIDYRPVPFRSAAEQAAIAADWARYNARPIPPPLQAPDYQIDPFSPWAPGGFMNSNTPNNKLPPLLRQPVHPPALSSRAASPALLSRAASLAVTNENSSRAASPAASQQSNESTKKAAAPPKKKKDPVEEARLQKEIDFVVEHFHSDYMYRIDCEEQRDMKNLSQSEIVLVARYLNVSKPEPHQLDLMMFNSKQIRKLAVACDVKGGGSMTLFAARKGIAMAKTMDIAYKNKEIANPNTTAKERKVNTLMRLLNACFHSECKALFIDLNDTKKRKDYEHANGGNPIKKFWTTVSEMTNDTERNAELGVVLESRESEDEHLHEMILKNHVNLNDFTTQTYVSAQQHVYDCMKARENALGPGGMTQSGHHSNDLWTYVFNPKFTKFHVNMQP